MRSVRVGPHGRGVYAEAPFRSGEIVERAPLLILPAKEVGDTTTLAYYVFAWSGADVALALGHGSLYNHAMPPNVFVVADRERVELIYQAARDIAAGEELTISYVADSGDRVQFLDAARARRARGEARSRR